MKENELFINLLKLYHENKLAHAYLFETNDIEKCFQDIQILIKKMACNSNFNNNCSNCEICHLIDENNMPNIIIIEPDGKSIKKDAVENLKKVFSVKPTYMPFNIYIIKYPEKMNASAYNKMLKFLEEPEDGIIGFYISKNKDNVASTIISRCEIVKSYYNNLENSSVTGISAEEYQKCNSLKDELIKKIDNKASDITWYNCSVLMKNLPSQEQIVCLMKLIYNTYASRFQNSKSSSALHRMKIVAKYLEMLNYNVNTALLLDSFVIEMGEVDEK